MPWLKVYQHNVITDCTEIPDESVDLVVTSPPYKRKDGYSRALMQMLGKCLGRVLRPGGIVFFNFGQLNEDLARPYEAQSAVREGSRFPRNCSRDWLYTGQTIAWVKSIAVPDGSGRSFVKGHSQPINSPYLLYYNWEFVFTYYKKPRPRIDALSIGVEYADKSNLTRGTRGKHGDIRCAGDTWYIPYETTGKTKKKKHAYEYPEELVRRCIKLSGVKPGGVIYEPFLGSGTSVCVAKECGLNAYATELDPENIHVAVGRHEKTKTLAE